MNLKIEKLMLLKQPDTLLTIRWQHLQTVANQCWTDTDLTNRSQSLLTFAIDFQLLLLFFRARCFLLLTVDVPAYLSYAFANRLKFPVTRCWKKTMHANAGDCLWNTVPVRRYGTVQISWFGSFQHSVILPELFFLSDVTNPAHALKSESVVGWREKNCRARNNIILAVKTCNNVDPTL